MRRALPAAVGLVASIGVLAAAVGLGLGWWSGAPAVGPPATPLAVTASLTPRPALFGDPIRAEVSVLYDPASVHAVAVAPRFGPYGQRGRPSFERSRAGRLERLRVGYLLECLSEACLPLQGPRTLQLPPLRVTATSGGKAIAQTAAWPPAVVTSRLRPADLEAAQLSFRRPRTLPPPVYGVSPGQLADALTAAAGILVAGGLVLLALEARRQLLRARRQRLARLSPLEAALLYARQAAQRSDPADRRKALGLLAETLPGGGEQLASAAERLAWGERPPSPERTLALADDVEGLA